MNDDDFMELVNKVAEEIIRRDAKGETCPSDLADDADGEDLKGSIVCSMLYAAQEALDNDEGEDGEIEDDES